jgi:hypothetical protein
MNAPVPWPPVDNTQGSATPAPLDPTAVQAGGPFNEGDTVRRTSETPLRYAAIGIMPGRNFTVRLGTQVRNGVISVEGTRGALDAALFELVSRAADHQPAPKPKPVWMPGDTGMATVSGKANVRVMRVLRDDRDHVARPWASDHPIGGWLLHEELHVTDFVPDEPRPLPTREQVVRAMHDDNLRHGEPRLTVTAREHLADAVLALLRGESR